MIEDDSCVYGPSECGGVSTVTYDGYTYDLVAIGDQCWFAENLRNEHYANGDAIPGDLSVGEWENADDTNGLALKPFTTTTCIKPCCLRPPVQLVRSG